MKITLNLDLRKANPLPNGLDVTAAYDNARRAYGDAKRMGKANPAKPGFAEHERERERLLNKARGLHGLLVVIAKLVGPEVTAHTRELKWAVATDYNGVPRVVKTETELVSA